MPAARYAAEFQRRGGRIVPTVDRSAYILADLQDALIGMLPEVSIELTNYVYALYGRDTNRGARRRIDFDNEE